ncbi:MAG: antitoxin AF2212-like protein [Jaaginema sp. PMC 1079.18]|nr:antitoxin AF2212-like protein [Jaaginema sp. PMC 1080.18]MEC4851050.1 antitoxin AF2212-like protein [Jaaginema sp. PMC 1079.18]MEC4866039.1 antitoxin AF2212-like protein [Jaaginema sp. PMC 1078.18]
MTQEINAVFDGQVLQPESPLNLAAGTKVKITIETVLLEPKQSQSFLQTAQSLQLEGHPDWSENIEQYLYGESVIKDD